MSVDYALLERARLQAAKKLPEDERLRAVATKRFAPFMAVFRSCSLTRIAEWRPVDKDDYGKKLAAALGIESGAK